MAVLRISRELRLARSLFFFFFNDTATTEIYTLSLHDALPIYWAFRRFCCLASRTARMRKRRAPARDAFSRSEEHTSELQSQSNLVCRLLLEKKKNVQSQIALEPFLDDQHACEAYQRRADHVCH